jgi:magnesium transporter
MDTIFFTTKQFRDSSAQNIIDTASTADTVMWIDLEQPTESDLARLHELFGFHTLALEDTFDQQQRPKAEEYQGHIFIVLKPINLSTASLEFDEMDIFVGGTFVVSVHSGNQATIRLARKRLESLQERTGFAISTTQILYALLDVVVDDYVLGLDQLDNEIETLSETIMMEPDHSTMNRLFQLRTVFNNVSRMILPTRDIINLLASHNLVFIDQNSQYYLRDVSDHLNGVIDRLHLGNDNMNSLMSMYVSSVSNQLNLRVNRLTVFAIVIGVVAVVTGFYGMNFEHTWPLWSEPLAIPLILLLIVTTVGLLLFFLRWRRWV